MSTVKKQRVVVAMSGGVDSSVTAALLLERGYEVVGMTMCFGRVYSSGRDKSCCGLEGINDAKRVAAALGIKHYALSFSKALKEMVIDDFISEYMRGRTPNPCVRCNYFLKFGALLDKARSLDADYIATGHYARVERDKRRKCFILRKGVDVRKDQSYFLYRLTQKQLGRVLMPLGEYNKAEVRGMAARFGLPVADKPGSQEVCFVPGDDYKSFIREYRSKEIKEGDIIDKFGRVLGRHKGICFYTLGQREGLGIAHERPLYVIGIDVSNNRLVVGMKEDTYSESFLVREPNFILPKACQRSLVLDVKIRYNNPGACAVVKPVSSGLLKVSFHKPQQSITPGQSAVFYKGDIVVGGGVIS